MPSLFTKHFNKSFLQRSYDFIEEKCQNPFDEGVSVKAFYEEVSTPLNPEESTETLLPYREKPKNTHKVVYCLNIALFCFSIILFSFSRFELLESRDQFNNTLIRDVSKYSPILDQVHIPILTVKRNGSFSPRDPPSIYRQDPSPAVDAAWKKLSNINTIPISTADVLKRGADPAQTAKFPERFGFGSDAHIGRIDVFHQIHCLNALRMEMFTNFHHYYGGKFPNDIPTPSHKAHTTHCLEVLLQNLMCSASVEPILHYWVDIQEVPFPDFDDTHVCRDFDTILEWVEQNSVPNDVFLSTIRRPEDAVIHKMSRAYKDMKAQNVGNTYLEQQQRLHEHD